MLDRIVWCAAVLLLVESVLVASHAANPPPFREVRGTTIVDGRRPYVKEAQAFHVSDVAVETGATLAQHWCSGCHDVGRPPANGAIAGVGPSFAFVARKSGGNSQTLEQFLSTRHTRMPDFMLSPYERRLLIAYILSLASQ